MKRVVVFALLLLLSACSRPDQAPSPDVAAGGQPESGDWLIVRYEAEPDHLNPLTSTSSYSQYITNGVNGSGVYEYLMRYNTTNWTLTEPLLATAFPEISEDQLQYTLTIRDGVRWHDGKPLTLDDVMFSMKALINPFSDTANVRGSFVHLTNVEALEGRKIRFTFKQRNYANVAALGFGVPIMPKHIFDAAGLLDPITISDIMSPAARNNAALKKFGEQFNNHPANRAPIGTGPWKFVRWDTSKEIEMVRNDDYWGPKPYLDKVIVRLINDETAALTALKSGDVDFNPRMQPIQYVQQTGGADFEQTFVKRTYVLPAYQFIAWNADRPMFKDKRVRQAMTMLVDRQQIIDTVLFGLGKLAESPLAPSSPDYNPNLKGWPYDPQRAMQLLDEAGWIDRDGDGVRDKDGIPFRFEFLGSAQNPITDKILPIVKEELRKAGIAMTERRLEFAVMGEAIQDKRFDAVTLGWTMDLITDPNAYVWHSSQVADRGSNYAAFRNAEADRLIEAARLEFDAEKRKQMYWRLQEIISDEQPYTFLYYQDRPAAYHKRFQNVQWLPVRPGYDITQWWVPKGAQRFGK